MLTNLWVVSRERRFTPPHHIQSSITHYTVHACLMRCVFFVENCAGAPPVCVSSFVAAGRSVCGNINQAHQLKRRPNEACTQSYSNEKSRRPSRLIHFIACVRLERRLWPKITRRTGQVKGIWDIAPLRKFLCRLVKINLSTVFLKQNVHALLQLNKAFIIAATSNCW